MKINYHKADIIISAMRKSQYPNTSVPEIAFAGRSNVGKSSLLNKILNRKSMARVSSTPGKTATINFFNIDDKLIIADLPGYGYAAGSREKIKDWGRATDEYLRSRRQLTQVIMLVDSRHKPSAEDIQMLHWVRNNFDYVAVVATKTDKLKKSEYNEHINLIAQTLELTENDVLIPFSIKDNECVKNFWDYIMTDIMQYGEDDSE